MKDGKLKVGIAIDLYKKKSFKKGLKKAGFDAEVGPGVVAGTCMLYVHYEPEKHEEVTKLINKLNHDARHSN